MSQKLQGNGIWESSRMMLPPHRERIIDNQKLHKKKTKPILHEDEWEIIFRNINSSMYLHEV
ncbi:YolD-like family protein, partial [Escherichia coli]|uniref:YolD-like family protein n=1 Tax=Escherichia coli TaxID=562 RepID=UPI003079B338